MVAFAFVQPFPCFLIDILGASGTAVLLPKIARPCDSTLKSIAFYDMISLCLQNYQEVSYMAKAAKSSSRRGELGESKIILDIFNVYLYN